MGGGFLLSIMLEDLGSFAGLLAFDIKLCDPCDPLIVYFLLSYLS